MAAQAGQFTPSAKRFMQIGDKAKAALSEIGTAARPWLAKVERKVA
jgi:hypothetical protein